MIRHCDGTDRNLVRPIPPSSESIPVLAWYVPCDCGLTFDDVDRMTIWPHEEV